MNNTFETNRKLSIRLRTVLFPGLAISCNFVILPQ